MASLHMARYSIRRRLREYRAARAAERLDRAAIRRPQLTETVFVGVTGSHGKTTTTALLGALLAEQAPTLVRYGANVAGTIARTILTTHPSHRYCVQEVSGHEPGAMRRHAGLFNPDVAIVTGIGSDHRKKFRTLEATAAEKVLLVESVPSSGLAVLNADDPLVGAMGGRCRGRVVYHGRLGADLRVLSAISRWPGRLSLDVEHRGERFTVKTRFVGVHWASSILAALLTALELGVPRQACLSVIEAFEPLFSRMSVHHLPNGGWYILDANKASFSGIEPCLNFLGDATAPRRTVVFGTLADYSGDSRATYHRVARMILAKADRVFFVGPSAMRLRRLASREAEGRIFMVEDLREAAALIGADVVEGEIFYIKGSHVDHIERLLLAQLAPVRCWRERCGKDRQCPSCRKMQMFALPFGRVHPAHLAASASGRFS